MRDHKLSEHERWRAESLRVPVADADTECLTWSGRCTDGDSLFCALHRYLALLLACAYTRTGADAKENWTFAAPTTLLGGSRADEAAVIELLECKSQFAAPIRGMYAAGGRVRHTQ